MTTYTNRTESVRKIKIKKRRSFAGLITLTLILILAMLLGGMQSADAFKPIEYKEITVCTGDSVWSIASKVNKLHYDGKKDIRQLVYTISEVNSLDSCVIQPGQQLQIPIQ